MTPLSVFETSTGEESLLAALRCGAVTLDDVCRVTGMDRYQADMLLSNLVTRGVVGVRESNYSARRYWREFYIMEEA